MKYLISLTLFIFLSFLGNLQAQAPFGFKVGLNTANFAGVEEDDALEGDLGSIIGYHFGLPIQFNINNNASILTEFLYYKKGFKLSTTTEVDNFTYKIKSKFVVNYFEIPLFFKYTFGEDIEEPRFYITAGPTFGYAINAHNIARVTGLGQTDRQRQPADLVELKYQRYEVSASLGTGLTIPVDPGNLVLELRYLHGFTNVNKEGGNDEANYNRGFSFSFGYLVSITDIE